MNEIALSKYDSLENLQGANWFTSMFGFGLRGMAIVSSTPITRSGGYLGARVAGVAPAAATAAQQYANSVANTLLPNGRLFSSSVGPISNAVAGAINATSFAVGNIVQSVPTMFPNGAP